MVGDGVAIDPLDGIVTSPCDGTVVAVAPTGHSVTLRAGNGAEILIHVGIDTVRLAGVGFAPAVAAGDWVGSGAPLIRFDIDAVAAGAPSLMTPVVVATEGAVVAALASGRVAAGDPLFEVRMPAVAAATPATGADDERAECALRVPLKVDVATGENWLEAK